MTMTSTTSPRDGHHMSFAKIAALPPPLRLEAPVSADETDDPQPPVRPPFSASQSSVGASPNHVTPDSNTSPAEAVNRDIDGLSKAVQATNISEKKNSGNTGFPMEAPQNGSLRREDSFEDDRTHLSNSSTKPTSFDSKSMASVTTFAMDEKDSLRPDDSASVQAIDEEESLSGHASGAANSLTGSETGARFRDVQRNRVPHHSTIFNDGSQRANGTIPGDPIANTYGAASTDGFPGQPIHGFPSEPDEKLLEAMKSLKDRLLILQLEERVRNFIQNSKEQSLELPPSNAFGRLLAHKLGDYYHLTHFVDNNVTSVRLHRTPFCRLPTPLSLIHAATNTTPPPTMPAMKIMRRTDGERPSTEGSIAASSSAPSKATSEAGDCSHDAERGGSSAGATPAKDRMSLSREEREAKYQEARERIFRDFSESSKTPEMNGEANTNMSRSSSSSGRKKAQRQKTPHDDSFEARSQFNAYYPGMNYANGPLPYNMGLQDPSFPNQPYMVGPGVVPTNMSGYVPNQNSVMYPGQANMNPAPHYPMPVSPQMSTTNPWQPGQAPQQMPYTGYPLTQSPAMASAKPAATLSNYPVSNNVQFQAAPAGWSSPPYQGAYPQPAQRNQAPVSWPNYQTPPLNPTTYPYAQYPGQPLNTGMPTHPGSHPLPGSFNRSHFNPQTRSFVPGGASGPVRYPNKNNPSSMGSYPSMQTNAQGQWSGYPDMSMKNQEQVMPNMTRGSLSGGKDSIAKWGTPSHLPPKPPPSEVPSDFEVKQRNVSSASHSYAGTAMHPSQNGPLVVSGGTGMPRTNQ
ncbi:hypothetical protein BDV18DRAFT_84150 [Aspergillus unguis]